MRSISAPLARSAWCCSIGMVLLDLVGEGEMHVGRVLEAWQREQDRIANRAWRRPGGLARMGGL
jgi:hypothetical protein